MSTTMCQNKPGPRCASHLRHTVQSLDERRNAAVEAFMNNEPMEDPVALARQRSQADEELAETLSERKAALARVMAMPEGPEKLAAFNEVQAATARYQRKRATLTTPDVPLL
jgi:hypothetical protein